MILNLLWNKMGFTDAERKSANIIASVLMLFGTLGSVSFAYPEHAGTIWGVVAAIIVLGLMATVAAMLIWMVWLTLADFLETK